MKRTWAVFFFSGEEASLPFLGKTLEAEPWPPDEVRLFALRKESGRRAGYLVGWRPGLLFAGVRGGGRFWPEPEGTPVEAASALWRAVRAAWPLEEKAQRALREREERLRRAHGPLPEGTLAVVRVEPPGKAFKPFSLALTREEGRWGGPRTYLLLGGAWVEVPPFTGWTAWRERLFRAGLREVVRGPKLALEEGAPCG
jgi:hypothetical protein